MAQITEASERPILKSKVFLCVTEFFSGMSVMAAELGASRLLAPYFSSSQIVWTIIIGTIMIALALGAVFGGRWTDKDPNPDKLYMRIMVAAALILGMGTGTYARQLKQYYPKMNIASVFGNGNMLTADVPNTTNRELFAKKPGSGSEENSMQQASKALNLRETTYERTGLIVTILTDDKAPVEVLGMHAIDQIIAEEAGPYRQILKDEGIGGLLRAVQ